MKPYIKYINSLEVPEIIEPHSGLAREVDSISIEMLIIDDENISKFKSKLKTLYVGKIIYNGVESSVDNSVIQEKLKFIFGDARIIKLPIEKQEITPSYVSSKQTLSDSPIHSKKKQQPSTSFINIPITEREQDGEKVYEVSLNPNNFDDEEEGIIVDVFDGDIGMKSYSHQIDDDNWSISFKDKSIATKLAEFLATEINRLRTEEHNKLTRS